MQRGSRGASAVGDAEEIGSRKHTVERAWAWLVVGLGAVWARLALNDGA